MTESTAADLIPRLMSEFGYPNRGASIVAEKLVACSAPVKTAFMAWWASGDISDLEVGGYTVSRLMTEHSMNPIAALLTLDWLTREPQKALRSLARGHDYVE